MLEQNVDLQSAVDIVTKMLATRVDDYVTLKAQMPSFGPEVDVELATYFKALEHYVQGTVVWYYESPSMSQSIFHMVVFILITPALPIGYFRGMDVTDKTDMIIPVYPRAEDTPTPSIVSVSSKVPHMSNYPAPPRATRACV